MTAALVVILLAGMASCCFAACHAALKLFSRKRLADLLEDRGRDVDMDALVGRLPRLILTAGLLRVAFALPTIFAVLEVVRLQMPDSPHWQQYSAAFVLAAIVVAVFNVAIPTAWSRYAREHLVAASLPVLLPLERLLGPLIGLMHVFDPMIRRISGHDLATDDVELSDEIIEAIETHDTEETVDEEQKEMLQAVFDLPKTTAGEIMTPRTDVKGIETDKTLHEVKDAVITVGHSRIPVYTESLDRIEGILYVKDLIQYLGDGKDFKLQDVLREPLFVPESKSVVDLLADFRQRTVHMAIVLDEYGGTAGLVTIEDILEELVGEIHDEYETAPDEPVINEISAGVFEADGRVDIDDLADILDLDFEDDVDFDTVGGFVFNELGRVPDEGEAFVYEAYRFEVTEAERTRVAKVRVTKAPEQAALEG